ncbi:MAG: YkgJ family cysteine cluster protein [Proteobacteria bacterium]|nr:YkgJ family cysteine cluster protein [Pseudomonadota bacterium]MBU1717363.1 YkgJ family cysteine cluster protein [Pseudomonadota bacterium]
MEEINVCLTCGACCASFRASFYWAEANDVTEGGVPVHLTEKLNDFRRVMIGTNQPKPRCIGLSGNIGHEVKCVIHSQRASICRDFDASWLNGVHNPRCDQARAVWGIHPLRPEDWLRPGHFPKAA